VPDAARRASSTQAGSFIAPMPHLSRQFMLHRAQKTCAVAEAIAASWQWSVKTPAELNAIRTACEAKLDLLTAADAATALARGQLDGPLQTLYETAVKALGLARRHFARIAGKEKIFDGITANNDSRESKRTTIRRVHKAWAQADTAWELNLPGGSVGFTTFQQDRIVIEGNDAATPPVPGLVDALAVAEQQERRAAEVLNVALTDMEEIMEAWYADATTVFPEGTAEGDQIRGQIPTTYDPDNEPLPIPPTPSGLAGGPGDAFGKVNGVCLPATFAAEYVWTLTLPGQTQEVWQITTTEPMVTFETNLPQVSGTLTVSAQNATGLSAPATPVNVTTA